MNGAFYVMKQTTNTVMMVRPASFRMNEQTAINNHYQKSQEGISADVIQELALKEFDDFVKVLQSEGVHVTVIQDRKEANTPDALFPNNWVSFHEDGTVITYPMFAENRRLERRNDIIELLAKSFDTTARINYGTFEAMNKFLEGTGSLILDRENKIAYCALSERAEAGLVEIFCMERGYQSVVFTANQSVNNERKAIYHTNVMMCVGKKVAVICLESIDNDKEKMMVKRSLEDTGKKIVEISEQQVESFAGNMLELKGANDQALFVMSERAKNVLTEEQKNTIEAHAKIVSSSLTTIETNGGGSARCMIAEIFLPKI